MPQHGKTYLAIRSALKLLLLPLRLPWRLIRRLFDLFVSDKDMTKAFWDSFKNCFVVGLLAVIAIHSFIRDYGVFIQAVTLFALIVSLVAHFGQLYGQFYKPFLAGGFRVLFRQQVFSTEEWTKVFGKYPGDRNPLNIRLYDDAYIRLTFKTLLMYFFLLIFPYIIQLTSLVVIGYSFSDYAQKLK